MKRRIQKVSPPVASTVPTIQRMNLVSRPGVVTALPDTRITPVAASPPHADSGRAYTVVRDRAPAVADPRWLRDVGRLGPGVAGEAHNEGNSVVGSVEGGAGHARDRERQGGTRLAIAIRPTGTSATCSPSWNAAIDEDGEDGGPSTGSRPGR